MVKMSILNRLHDVFAENCQWTCRFLSIHGRTVHVMFLNNVADDQLLSEGILKPLQKLDSHEVEQLSPDFMLRQLPLKKGELSRDLDQICHKLMLGWSYVWIQDGAEGLLMYTAASHERSLSKAEIESDEYGPQVAFVEELSTNLSLLYKLLPDSKLCVSSLEIGNVSKTVVNIVYLKEYANEDQVALLRSRISSLQHINGMLDSLKLAQLLDDNVATLFPTMLHTERPDRVCQGLLANKIAIFVDGSPFAVLCPVTIYEFFHAGSDMYQRWIVGMLLRLLRMSAMIASVFVTSLYVAAITFHYQVIPPELLKTLIQSHSRVPFPPILEALLLEVMIELLRESSIRMPSKVGQTMGVVGGIVIGQAAVDAGFISNILLMTVALGTLSSFVVSNFAMGNSLQIIRFPLIILAGTWGGIGIVVGACFIIIHLARQTSLGVPYLQPMNILAGKTDEQSVLRMIWKWVKRENGSYRIRKPKEDFAD